MKQAIKCTGPHLRRVQAMLMLCLMALASSCVMPVTAAHMPTGSLSIALDAAKPYDPAADLTQILLPDVPIQREEMKGTPGFAPTMLVPGPAARPYVFSSQNAQDVLRATLCLTAAIYYEAGNEPEEGQRAVAQVVLNRVRHPAYPDTVCGVVYQGTERGDRLCQFTFGCDGSMARVPDSASWARARRIALAALAGSVYAPVGTATHYHTLAVNPFWNKSLTPTAIVGAHIFFRWPGGAGEPKAFHSTYRGGEPAPAPKTVASRYVASDVPAVAQVSDLPAGLPFTYRGSATVEVAKPTPVDNDSRYLPGALPESEVLPQYRESGQWIVR